MLTQSRHLLLLIVPLALVGCAPTIADRKEAPIAFDSSERATRTVNNQMLAYPRLTDFPAGTTRPCGDLPATDTSAAATTTALAQANCPSVGSDDTGG